MSEGGAPSIGNAAATDRELEKSHASTQRQRGPTLG